MNDCIIRLICVPILHAAYENKMIVIHCFAKSLSLDKICERNHGHLSDIVKVLTDAAKAEPEVAKPTLCAAHVRVFCKSGASFLLSLK